MASVPAGHEAKLEDFVTMSGATRDLAMHYLEANEWDLAAATSSYFQDEEEQREEAQTVSASQSQAVEYTGPRTLDGRPAPQASGSSRAAGRSAPAAKKKGIATLGSLGGSGRGDDHDDDDGGDHDDDDDDDGRGNLFAGGEKSGLAVQDPRQNEGGTKKIMEDILAKARANAADPSSASEAGSSQSAPRFRGTGVTLGGDGVESRSIPDPRGASSPSSSAPQERVLHIWQDGFSIDDGDLRRFDDPANARDLQMIRSGRAPLHLMNVQTDQPVEVKLHQHDTPYTPQPKQYKPFGGSGRRLGSAVPGDGNETASAAAAAPVTTAAAGSGGAQPGSASSSSRPAQAAAGSGGTVSHPDCDESQPTIVLRLQLPDGSRMPVRFNSTQVLGDVYDYVQSLSTELKTRPWVLSTTFPNKEHPDVKAVLGEVPEFKKGGTAVVKWC